MIDPIVPCLTDDNTRSYLASQLLATYHLANDEALLDEALS